MRLILTLMGVLPAAFKASAVQQDLMLGGDSSPTTDAATEQGKWGSSFDNPPAEEETGNAAVNAELLEMRQELAEAHEEFRLQAGILKNVVAEANVLEADYRDHVHSQHTKGSALPDAAALSETPEDTIEEMIKATPDEPLADDVILSKELSGSHSKHEVKDGKTRHTSLRKPHTASKLAEESAQSIHGKKKDKSDKNKDKRERWNAYGHASNGGRVALQLIFGIFYYYIVVQYYPKLNPATSHFPQPAVDLQKMNPVAATVNASPKDAETLDIVTGVKLEGLQRELAGLRA